MFTSEMCKRLVELVAEHQDDLFPEQPQKDSAAGQNAAWKLVADTLNTEYPDQGSHSVEQVKQKHSNLKKLAKQDLQDQKKSASKIGGGGPMPKQQLFEQVQFLYEGSPSFEGLSSGIETSLVGLITRIALERVPQFIIAAAVLHNICRLRGASDENDEDMLDEQPPEEVNADDRISTGSNMRNSIVNRYFTR